MKAFETFTTITGRVIKVRSNAKKRQYTIKTEAGTYITTPMGKEEFESNQRNTGNDWNTFLKYGDYFKVK